jgi:hypothetical protein
MSTTKNDSSFSGMLGESVTVRQVRGKVVIKNRPHRQPGRPTPGVKDTSKHEAAMERFLEASQYARQQISLAESKEMYGKRVTDKKRSAYVVAMTDYLIAPKVRVIDAVDYHGTIGDTITVKATDDFMVTKVKVIITHAAGALVEEGEAGPDTLKVNLWGYKATAANPTLAGTTIRAIAYDRPGNSGTAEIVL